MAFQFSAYQIAELAVEVEGASTSFYKQLATTTEDPAIRDTFNLLAQQELGHKNAFASMAKALKENAEEYEYSIDLHGMMEYTLDKLKNTAFHLTTGRPQHILDALDVAVRAEETAVDVYTQLRHTLSGRFHQTLDDILKVERYHCRWVTDLREKVKRIV